MAVGETVSATNGQWLTLDGTKQEIIDQAAALGLTAKHCCGFTHDGTEFVALFCRHG